MNIPRLCELLSTSDAANELELSSDRVRQLAKNGRLPAMRTRSGTYVFVAEDVAHFKERRASVKTSVA